METDRWVISQLLGKPKFLNLELTREYTSIFAITRARRKSTRRLLLFRIIVIYLK
jgi:hypothetical protein